MALDSAYFDVLTARTADIAAGGFLSYASVGLPAILGTMPADWLRDLDAMDATQKAAYITQLTALGGGVLWAVKIITYLNTGINL